MSGGRSMILKIMSDDGCPKGFSPRPVNIFWSYYWRSSMLHMEDSLQNPWSCLGDQSIEYKICPWKMFLRCVKKEGQLVTRCQGVSSESWQYLHRGLCLLSRRLMCLLRLQWPVMNCTSLLSSNLLKWRSTLSILFEIFGNQILVCLHVSRLPHLFFQLFSNLKTCWLFN